MASAAKGALADHGIHLSLAEGRHAKAEPADSSAASPSSPTGSTHLVQMHEVLAGSSIPTYIGAMMHVLTIGLAIGAGFASLSCLAGAAVSESEAQSGRPICQPWQLMAVASAFAGLSGLLLAG